MKICTRFASQHFAIATSFRINARSIVLGFTLAMLSPALCRAATLPGTAPVIAPAGGFGIDGDLLANSPTLKIGDWVTNGAGSGGFILNADGTPIKPESTFHVIDVYNSPIDNVFAAGKYYDNPVTSWLWRWGNAGDKVDINNAVIHITTATNGHQWAIVSADRASGNGDAYIDFEFLQDALTMTQTNAAGMGGFTNTAPHGGRRVHDFLLTLAFTGGGSTAEFYVQQWKTNSASGGYDYFTMDIASNLPPNSVFAAVNPTSGTFVPYGAFGGTTYGLNTFAEAAVDLTALIGADFDPCTSVAVKTILVKTKQSASRSASLGDMITPVSVDLTLGLADAGPSQTKCPEGAFTTFALNGIAHPNINGIASMSWSVVSATQGASIQSTTACTNCLSLPVNVRVTNAPATAVLRLTVTDTAGCSVTDDVVLTVNPPTSVSGPANQATCPGGTATFSAVASGVGPFSYQWMKNGSPLSGATSSSLTLTGVSAADAGSYCVVVTSPCASRTNCAVLSLNQNVAVSLGPENATKCPGENATFSVTASGTGLNYQWYKGETTMPGETGSSLTLNNISAADAGLYTVIVGGLCGEPIASGAMLSVNQNVAVSTPPDNLTKCPGESATFNVAATGTGLFCQWYKNSNALSGETGPNLTLNNVSAADAGIYSVTISGTCGPSITRSASLAVNQNVAVISAPQNQVKCPGEDATLSVTATGTGLACQWYKDGNELAGETTGNLNLHNVTAADAGTYSVTIIGNCGAPVTQSAALTVNESVLISAAPASLTKCPGENASFSIVASGTGLTYQWFKENSPLTGETNGNLALNNVNASSAGNYSVTVIGTCGSPQTRSASLTVNQNVEVSSPPANLTRCPGENAVFSVTATGTGLSYQWFKGNDALSGETGSSLTLNNVTAANAGDYSVTISGACGNPMTRSATLTVNQNVAVSSPPASLTKCPGDSASFSVTASGTGLSYQWFKGGSPLNGETSSSLNLNSVTATDAGLYSVTVSGQCGTPVTHNATLTVNQNVAVSSPPANQIKCPGESANFSVAATGTSLSYQWFKDGNPLNNQNGSNLALNNLLAADAGTYSVTVSGACGASQTRSATLIVNEPVSIETMPAPSACPGDPISLNAVTHGTGPFTYLWIKDGKVLPDATGAVIAISSATVLDAGFYTVIATGKCTSYTNYTTVNIYNPTITSALTDQTSCFGRDATFSTTPSGTGPFSYVWKKDGVVMSGATSNSITITKLKASDVGTYTVEVTGHCNSTTRSATLAVQNDGLVSPATFANSGSILINDFSPATPYPASIEVYCVPAPLANVTVTISNLSHTYGADLDLLLLSPSGKAIMLMSDAGGLNAINNAVLTFSDAALGPLPSASPIVSGIYKPTNYGSSDNIPNPAPLGPFATSLAEFNGTDANGTWSLFVIDDARVDAGTIAGGWSLRLMWANEIAPELVAPVMRNDGSFQATLRGQAGKTYVIEGSDDFVNWVPVSTNTLNQTTGEFVDPTSAGIERRFYRAVHHP